MEQTWREKKDVGCLNWKESNDIDEENLKLCTKTKGKCKAINIIFCFWKQKNKISPQKFFSGYSWFTYLYRTTLPLKARSWTREWFTYDKVAGCMKSSVANRIKVFSFIAYFILLIRNVGGLYFVFIHFFFQFFAISILIVWY